MITIIHLLAHAVTTWASILNLALNPLARLRRENDDLRRERDTLSHQLGGHLRDTLRMANHIAHLQRRHVTLLGIQYHCGRTSSVRVTRKAPVAG